MEILTDSSRTRRVFCGFPLLLMSHIGIWLVIVSTLLMPFSSHARKYKIEAAFLYNFLNYITWPDSKQPDPAEEATICIYKDEALENALRYIQAQKKQERILTIIDLQSLDSLTACHIAFISRSNSTVDISSLSRQSPGVLLVGNSSDFVERGGMIELIEEEERITFTINHTKLMSAGFQVSSRLLSIAREVK